MNAPSPRLLFEPRTHRYTLVGDGRPRALPSVTGILKMDPRSPDWERIAFMHGTAARDKGSHVHELIKARLQAAPDAGRRSKVAKYLKAMDRWMTDFDVTLSLVEAPLYHAQLLYAGTPDLVGMIKRSARPGPFIGDFKTGAPSPLHGLQLAGYDMMLTPVPRPLRRRRLGLYLSGESVTVHEYEDPGDYRRFQTLLSAFWRMHHAEDI